MYIFVSICFFHFPSSFFKLTCFPWQFIFVFTELEATIVEHLKKTCLLPFDPLEITLENHLNFSTVLYQVITPLPNALKH